MLSEFQLLRFNCLTEMIKLPETADVQILADELSLKQLKVWTRLFFTSLARRLLTFLRDFREKSIEDVM